MSTQVSEIVTFHLNAGVSVEDYLTTSRKSGDWTKSHPGFIARHLSRGQDGSWTDVTIWDSAETAKASQESFMKQDFATEMLSMIDQTNFSMIHRDILWQVQ